MKFRFNPNLDCVHNAYQNAQVAREEGEDPRVVFSHPAKHAYLKVGGEVLNRGVTWGTDNYPDYSAEELARLQQQGLAEDITDSLDAANQEEGGGLFSLGGKQFPLFKNRLK